MIPEVEDAVTQLDSLIRELQATGPGGHADHNGWSLTGWPNRAVALCLRCHAMVPTTPSGELRSHDDEAMMACVNTKNATAEHELSPQGERLLGARA